MRVLVIAESADGAEILKSGVRLGGHELTEVLPLDSALLPALERGRPDVLLLEARSPSVDLLDRLLDAMGPAAVPFAVFAGDASSQVIENGVRAGACGLCGRRARSGARARPSCKSPWHDSISSPACAASWVSPSRSWLNESSWSAPKAC